MKKVRILNRDIDIEIVVDYNNIIGYDVPELGLNKGDNLRIFYLNNKNKYVFESLNYYDKPYTQEDKLKYLLQKRPILSKLIDEFDLEAT